MPRKLPDLLVESLIPDAKGLGAAIRVARCQAGLSLVDAAVQLGIAKQTLANLETKGSVGLETAVRVARELGVSIFAVPSSEREPVRRAIEETRKGLKAPAVESLLPGTARRLPRARKAGAAGDR